MKKIVSTLLSLILFITSSCSEWLDVKPKSEIKTDVMFDSEQGFKDAIIGCYIMMSSPSLYGSELTITFLEALGQQYEYSAEMSGGYLLASKYRYTEGGNLGKIDGIWSKAYNEIANVNNIIENLELKKSVLHPTNYAMIKAEAYGLRAYLHFDLVRLFSYGNLAKRKEVLSDLAIPYVTIYDKITTKQHTLQEVLNYISSDLETSLALFEKYDPMSLGERPEDYSIPTNDNFYSPKIRPYRFNIKAAYATRARFNMWIGNYEQALKDSEYLINELPTNWISDSKINGEMIYKDLTFSEEQLFGLETFKRYDEVIKPNFSSTLSSSSRNTNQMFLTTTTAKKLYEVEDVFGAADYRYRHQIKATDDNYEIIKFYEEEKMTYTNNMPLIRKPELYYNAAECLLNKGDEESKIKALFYINSVRFARGIPKTYDLSNDLTIEQVKNELFKEWKKEFLGEGQMFYYYKRLGYINIPGTNIAGDDKVYILPLPEREVDFGGRIDVNKK